jgi:hypothetical protein
VLYCSDDPHRPERLKPVINSKEALKELVKLSVAYIAETNEES